MLFVFQVDTGSMLTFDMNLAMDSVHTLKEAITLLHGIPLDRQVLLVSGGECLDANSFVCNYGGTDTNPIFLFNINNIEYSSPSNSQVFPETPPPTTASSPTIPYELQENCPPTYELLLRRSALAQTIYETSKETVKKSQVLIHDQHLQHQGWAAVIANLDDFVTIFKNKINAFNNIYQENNYEQVQEVLDQLPGVKEELSKLPLLASIDESEKTVLDWMSSSENNLESLADKCRKCMDILDPKAIDNLLKEANSVMEKAQQNNMKEIKGLTSRLSALDGLLTTSQKLLSESRDLSLSINNNVSRLSDLKEASASILPDLCVSHLQQLQVLYRNEGQLDEISRRCAKAKDELVLNLNTRLKWVMLVQKNVKEIHLKISVYFQTIKQFNMCHGIAKQVILFPVIYKQSVKEIIERKLFEKQFNKVQKESLSRLEKLMTFEKERRLESFTYENNFLVSALFPGLVSCSLPDPVTSPVVQVLPEVTSAEASIICGEQKLGMIESTRESALEAELERVKETHKRDLEAVKSRAQFLINSKGTEDKETRFKNLIAELGYSRHQLVSIINNFYNKQEAIGPLGLKLLKEGKISTVSSCRVGESVFVFWSDKYDTFVVYHQDSNNNVHFLHTECHPVVKDLVGFTGVVLDKEFCVAKRATNRYGVPEGFHFYRVKVCPEIKFQHFL